MRLRDAFLHEARDPMSGMTFSSPTRGPIAWTTIGREPLRLLLEGMVGADLGWEIAGKHCPDCMYAEVTREGALKALEAARLYACRNPKFLLDDPMRWKKSANSRVVFFQVVNGLLEELSSIDDEVIEVLDDWHYCEHPKMKTLKRRRRKKS